MKPIVSLRDLEVWQLGMESIVGVYRVTEHLPSTERFGLVSQMRRPAVSIPANIAEGHARRDGAYLNHVRIALGSQGELATQIEAATRLGFLGNEPAGSLLTQIDEVRRMLHGRQITAASGAIAILYACAVWLV